MSAYSTKAMHTECDASAHVQEKNYVLNVCFNIFDTVLVGLIQSDKNLLLKPFQTFPAGIVLLYRMSAHTVGTLG